MAKHQFQSGDEVRTDDGSIALVLDDKTYAELDEMGVEPETNGLERGHEYAALVRESDGAHAVRDARTLEPTGRRFDEEELFLADMLGEVPEMVEAESA